MLQASRLFAVILYSSASVVCATPLAPAIVYRVDTRPPDEVFVYGFRAWGDNYNIVAHVNGHSCTGNTRTSAFISTMVNFEMANALAENHLQQRNETYIYSIRADSNFYNAAASVDYFQSYNPASPLSIASLRTARRVREWVAIGRIPPENIHSVLIRRRNGASDIHMNIMFDNIHTQANENVYTDFAERTLRHYRFPLEMRDSTNVWMSACFSGCPTGPSSYVASAWNSPTTASGCIEQRVYSVENALALIL